MRRRTRATAWAATLFASLAASSSLAITAGHAADLIWEVESPFRFFKPTRSFALHEAAFNAARGDPSAPLPADIIWRTERRLTIPIARTLRTRIAARRRAASATSKADWAGRRRPWARPATDSNGHPRRYLPVCERKILLGQREGRLRAAGGAHGQCPHRA